MNGRILVFDNAVAAHYAAVIAVRRTAGRPISFPDAAIAATCLAHDCAAATKNTSDFIGTGVDLVDPREVE
ncbi:MAG: PIN domain-containing protein [Nakamurella sp.]